MPKLSKQHYKGKLGELLQNLEGVCKLYDEGNTGIAVVIAAILRVLLHDHGSTSVSLLTRVDGWETLLLDSCGEQPYHIDANGVLNEVVMAYSIGVLGSANPKLGNEGKLVPAKDWWKQYIYINLPIRYARRKLVLDASNKDGGTHFDEKYPKDYRKLAVEGDFFRLANSGPGSFDFGIHLDPDTQDQTAGANPVANGFGVPFLSSHLAGLRQMANEVLSSPDLKKIVTS